MVFHDPMDIDDASVSTMMNWQYVKAADLPTPMELSDDQNTHFPTPMHIDDDMDVDDAGMEDLFDDIDTGYDMDVDDADMESDDADMEDVFGPTPMDINDPMAWCYDLDDMEIDDDL